MRTDRRTDMTKLIVAFRNYENAPENTFNFWCEVELDRANRSLPVPAIRKTLLRNGRKHDKIRGKKGKKKRNKKKKSSWGVVSHKIANSGSHLRHLKYPFHISE
jgi:hypothetical protein